MVLNIPKVILEPILGNCTYHVQTNNLAICLLDFSQLHEEVPETGFGDDIIRCENAHAVELRSRIGLGR
jgi:hypothetical protein